MEANKRLLIKYALWGCFTIVLYIGVSLINMPFPQKWWIIAGAIVLSTICLIPINRKKHLQDHDRNYLGLAIILSTGITSLIAGILVIYYHVSGSISLSSRRLILLSILLGAFFLEIGLLIIAQKISRVKVK